jgi:hypothetical protein
VGKRRTHVVIQAEIGEEKVAAVSRLFFFSFVATFDNFCPSVRPFSVLFSDKRHHFSALFG